MDVRQQKAFFLTLYQGSIKPKLPKGYRVKLEVSTVCTRVEVRKSNNELVGLIPIATCFGPSAPPDQLATLVLMSAGVVSHE